MMTAAKRPSTEGDGASMLMSTNPSRKSHREAAKPRLNRVFERHDHEARKVLDGRPGKRHLLDPEHDAVPVRPKVVQLHDATRQTMAATAACVVGGR